MIPPNTAATPWPEPLHPRDYDHLVSPDRHSHALCARPAALPAVPVMWKAQDTHVGRAWIPVAAPTTDRQMPWDHLRAAIRNVTQQPWFVATLIWFALHQPWSVRQVTPAVPRPELPDAHTWTIGTAELRHVVGRWTADWAATVDTEIRQGYAAIHAEATRIGAQR